MKEGKAEYYQVKISAKDLLEVFSRRYGPIENLKFEWTAYYIVDENDIDRQLQLSEVIQRRLSSTLIEFEAKLWDSQSYDDDLANRKMIEDEFQIAEAISEKTDGLLPLTFITARFRDLDAKGIPNSEADIWLEYGDV